MAWDLGIGNNQIFIDGEMAMEARWPNAENVMTPQFLEIDSGTVEGTHAEIYDADLTGSGNDWLGATVHAIWEPRYHAITGEVVASRQGGLSLALHSGTRGDINSAGIYYITGSFNALDQDREWFYDTNRSAVYLVSSGGIPKHAAVEAQKAPGRF
jgi:hypothetical protein